MVDGGWRVGDLSEYNWRLGGPTTQISNNADVDNDGAY